MGQGFEHLEGAREVDYRGSRYALGRTSDAYAIWDLAGGPSVRTFPLTDEAWPEAWLTYQAWEAGTRSPTGEAPPVSQPPGAAPPYQQPGAPAQYQQPGAVPPYQQPGGIPPYQQPGAAPPYQQPGAAVMDYPGGRFGLGRAEGQYYIWDLEARAAVANYPETGEGWRDAWTRFQELERPYTFVPPREWSKGRPIPIRAMRAGQIIGWAFKLYFAHFWRLVAAAAIILIPVYAISGTLTFSTGELVSAEPASAPFGSNVTVNGETFVWEVPFWVDLINGVVSVLGYSLLVGAVYALLVAAATGRRPTLPDGLRVSGRRIGPLVVVGLIQALAILLAALPAIASSLALAANPSVGLALLDALMTLLVIAPILYVIVRFLYAPQAVVVEAKGGVQAVGRSWSLVRGLGWKALGTILLALLIVVGVFIVAFLFFLIITFAFLVSNATSASGGPEGFSVFFVGLFILVAVLASIATPFVYTVSLLLYLDARVRKEGLSEEVLAREFGTSFPETPTTVSPASGSPGQWPTPG
jgi:hypothetical protein